MTNAAGISSGDTGLYIDDNGYSGNFSGGVLNTGNITSTSDYGIFVESNAESGSATFSGGVTNTGAIKSASTGLYVEDNGYSNQFLGGVVNGGAINAGSSDYGI